MVQEAVNIKNALCVYDFNKCNAKRVGFESMQKREQERKEAQRKVSVQQNNQYGAWGPIFKNRENFASMNYC